MQKYTALSVVRYGHYACFLLAVVLFAAGHVLDHFNLLLCSVLTLFFSNVLYGFCNARKRSAFLLFHATLFTFLISRPTISMLKGHEWWTFTAEAVTFALNVLMLSLLFLRIGNAAFEHFCCSRTEPTLKRHVEPKTDPRFLKTLQTVSLLFFAVTMVFYLAVQVDKLLFMHGRAYEELYLSYSSRLPRFFSLLGSMMKYALCLFLATLPSKKWAFTTMGVYVFSAVPDLLIGVRNTIVLRVVFAFLYYLIRDHLENGSRWFGKAERIAVIVLCPLVLLLLSAYNYIRDGATVTMGVWDSIVDLFYKQGVSFEVLCRAYEALPHLPDVVGKNYTFGPFIDYIVRGSAGQFLFDTVPIPSQNSVITAVYGNSFAHSMSYIAHHEYLQGSGYGSSYILELFADWGFGGVAVGSTLLGAFLSFIPHAFRSSVLCRTILLLCTTQLFFAPRAEALGWLSFIITIQFWLAVVLCYTVAALFTKSYFICRKDVVTYV